MGKTLAKVVNRPLTRKQAIFVKELIDNPKQTATDAALKAYNTTNRESAGAIAGANMQKPVIRMALAQYNDLFESAIVNTVRDWQDADAPRKREIAMQSAQFAYDHIHGKATVKVEQQTSIVRININLSGDDTIPPPPEDLENETIGPEGDVVVTAN